MHEKITVLLLLVLTTALFVESVKPVSASAVTDNSWASKAPMNLARANLGVAVVNGKIYAIGGDTSTIMGNVCPGTGRSYQLVGTNEEYDPNLDSWTTKTSMPTARALFGITTYQNKIYCIGGYYTNYHSEIDNIKYFDTSVNEVYDPSTDSWNNKAPMPSNISSLQANTVGDMIYVIAVGSNITYIYNPASDSWALGNFSPYEVSGSASAVIGSKIYTIGKSANSTVIQAYDTTQDKWSIISTSNTAVEAGNGCGVTSGFFAPQQICFFDQTVNSTNGSVNQLTDIYATTHIYNPLNGSWSVGASMPSNRICAGVALVNDTFYIIGGREGTWGYITMEYASALIEQYTPIGYGTAPTLTAVQEKQPVQSTHYYCNIYRLNCNSKHCLNLF